MEDSKLIDPVIRYMESQKAWWRVSPRFWIFIARNGLNTPEQLEDLSTRMPMPFVQEEFYQFEKDENQYVKNEEVFGHPVLHSLFREKRGKKLED
ncbi:MAG: hypothetical protein IPP69_18165 [Flavobacteriales bacterium]|nr:hypothetical protein [Flavobacteriales bacterium]